MEKRRNVLDMVYTRSFVGLSSNISKVYVIFGRKINIK